jgi:hypothetical protein
MKKNIGSTFFLKFVKLIVSRILRRYRNVLRRIILYNRNRRKKITLKIKKLECLDQLKELSIDRVNEYNQYHPHSSLRNKSLISFLKLFYLECTFQR